MTSLIETERKSIEHLRAIQRRQTLVAGSINEVTKNINRRSKRSVSGIEKYKSQFGAQGDESTMHKYKQPQGFIAADFSLPAKYKTCVYFILYVLFMRRLSSSAFIS